MTRREGEEEREEREGRKGGEGGERDMGERSREREWSRK